MYLTVYLSITEIYIFKILNNNLNELNVYVNLGVVYVN
jgi:hypothetical protein